MAYTQLQIKSIILVINVWYIIYRSTEKVRTMREEIKQGLKDEGNTNKEERYNADERKKNEAIKEKISNKEKGKTR